MDPVRFGVVGYKGTALPWLDVINDEPDAVLIAVADREPGRTAEIVKRRGALFEDDDRALLIHHRLDVVVVALSPAGVERVLPTAAEHGVAALLESPPARSFEEALASTKRFEEAGLPLLVCSGWRLDDALAGFRQMESRFGPVIQASAHVSKPLPAPLGWRADRVRAGGGVLASAAYDALDMLLDVMGLPADVLATVRRVGYPSAQPYDVEDAATLMMRYDDNTVATVIARWGPPPEQAVVHLSGRGGCITVANGVLTIHDPDEAASNDAPKRVVYGKKTDSAPRPAERTRAVRAIIDALRSVPNKSEPPHGATTALRDHLPTVAVLESAYLSARTGEPEPPHQAYERSGVTPPVRHA
ncbi:MAG: Gfo/Idh/MocA family oxidoreductase [Phycisphaerae bacterium]